MLPPDDNGKGPGAAGPGPHDGQGCYVYCVAAGAEALDMGGMGIDGNRLYTVAHQDLCALAHDCPAQPYGLATPEATAARLLAHHRVVQAAWERWGTVLPIAFNTIIRAGQDTSARGNLEAWLRAERVTLKEKLDALAAKTEYAVQVFWDPNLVAQSLASSNPDSQNGEDQMGALSPGLAYMHRLRLQRQLQRDLHARAAAELEHVCATVHPCAEGVHVGTVQPAPGKQRMLANLSCLVSPQGYLRLVAELERLAERPGLSVRLVGPLPPYSFCR
ncbi:MAG: GvpL/GvpF family gas vesicle protein [Chloroflexi bacterium]|nr:GvpL/GvpF family gas vesicle protein [Chloroflexota bacterium]